MDLPGINPAIFRAITKGILLFEQALAIAHIGIIDISWRSIGLLGNE